MNIPEYKRSVDSNFGGQGRRRQQEAGLTKQSKVRDRLREHCGGIFYANRDSKNTYVKSSIYLMFCVVLCYCHCPARCQTLLSPVHREEGEDAG
jgi:hypothetical protein